MLVDSLLVLFHQAYFALLPNLGNNWPLEKKALQDSFRLFGESLSNLTQKYRILALYYKSIGDSRLALKNFQMALHSTHSDADDFLTIVQTYWSFLIDEKEFKGALLLLLDVYPRIVREDLDEMRELFMLTFDLMDKSPRR